MKISIITDELSRDVHTAVELGARWGVTDFELRGLGARRLPDHDPAWTEVVEQYVSAGEINITALSPGLFKHIAPGSPEITRLRDDVFDRTLRLCETFQCNRMILFAFAAEGYDSIPQELVDTLGDLARRAESAGVDLAFETGDGTFTPDGAGTVKLLDAVGAPNLYANWDPANALIAGVTENNQGIDAIASRVAQVHVKDAVPGRFTVVGEGEVDWPAQIAALRAVGFDGFFAVEHHLRPCVAQTETCLARLRELIG